MAQRRKRFFSYTCKLRAFLFDGWLLDFERRCFGWIYTGDRIETTYNIEKAKTSNQKFHCYFRVSPYTNNLLFKLTELISLIIYFIRAIVRYLLIPVIALGLIAALTGAIGIYDDPDIVSTGLSLAGVTLLVYVLGLVVPTLIVSGLGALWRNIFKIDDVLREKLEENGYDPEFEEWGANYEKDVEDPHLRIE